MKPLNTHPCYSEALSFTASRLLLFKRLYYPWVCELISEKYGIDQPANLFSDLAEKDAIGYYNGMIFVKNEKLLRGYSEKNLATDHACQGSTLMSLLQTS